MANEERIDELISPKAFEQVERLESDLEKLQSGLAKTVIEANKLNNALSKSSNSRDFDSNAAKAEQAAEKIKQAAAKTLLAQERLAIFRAKAAADFEKAVQREIVAQEKKSKQLETASQKEIDAEAKKQAAYKKTAEQIANNSRPYTILSNTLETQRKRAQDLAIIYGENSKQFLEAAKSVQTLDARLKAIDAVLGKSQRNVGNYRSGFSGLSNSVNQLTREFPAFTFSVQTGLLALSNNFPIFFDQIKQTQAEIKALRAEGQKVPGLFKQLAGTIFSLNTALSIAITLSTVYGKEIGNFISAIFKGKTAVDAFTQSQKMLAEVTQKGFESAQGGIASLNTLYRATQNVALSDQERLKAVNELQKQYPKYFENIKDEAFLTGQAANAYKLLKEELIATSFARAAEDRLAQSASRQQANLVATTELRVKQLQALKEENKVRKEANDIAKVSGQGPSSTGAGIGNLSQETKVFTAAKKRQDLDKQINDLATDTLRLRQQDDILIDSIDARVKKYGVTVAGVSAESAKNAKTNTDYLDRQIQLIEFEIETQKKLSENEKASLEDRLKAVQNFTDASKRLADLNAQRELKQADLTRDKIASIYDKQKQDKITADSDGAAATLKINEEAEKELARLIKEGLKTFEEAEKKKIEALQVSIKEQQEQLSGFADSALQGLAEQYSKGIINEQQYAQSKLDIQRQYVLDSINEEIKGVEAIIEAKKNAGLDTASDEKALADLRKKLSKETTDQQISDLEKLAEREKDLNDKKKELAKEVAELGISIVNGVFENQKNKIQEQIDLTDQQAEKDIENVNNSLATEQEKADKIAVIEAQAESRKKVLEQQQREVQQRQARFDRAVSIAKIIQNTAVGVTAALTSIPPNVPLSIVIGAIGLAQVGQLLATPIPQYFTGTNSSKGGLALTDEKGPEGYITPSGKAFIGNDKPTLRNLEAGTKIIPHHEMVRLMGNPSSVVKMESDKMDVTALINSQQAETKKLIKAMSKQKPAQRPVVKLNNMNDYIVRNFGK